MENQQNLWIRRSYATPLVHRVRKNRFHFTRDTSKQPAASLHSNESKLHFPLRFPNQIVSGVTRRSQRKQVNAGAVIEKQRSEGSPGERGTGEKERKPAWRGSGERELNFQNVSYIHALLPASPTVLRAFPHKLEFYFPGRHIGGA